MRASMTHRHVPHAGSYAPCMEPGTYKLLAYDYVADILERRDPHRPGHLAAIEAAVADGRMVAAGAVGTPPTGGLLVFADVDDAVIEEYATADPYVTAGLVTAWRIDPWTVVAAR